MFIGVAEDDSDTENPMPPFDIYGPSNLTQETLQAVPWDIWERIGKAAWPQKEAGHLTFRLLNKGVLEACGDERFCRTLYQFYRKKWDIMQRNKKRLRKFVSTFKNHIIHNGFAYHEDSDVDSDQANTDATDYDSDDVYIKGPARYNRYTDEFLLALGRFQTIKAKLERIEEFEDALNERWENQSQGLIAAHWGFCCWWAMENKDWAECKSLAHRFHHALRYLDDARACHPHYRALKLEWAKDIRVFTRKSGKWWCWP